MLRRGVAYQDLGADHFERRDRARLASLESLLSWWLARLDRQIVALAPLFP